MSQEPLPDIGMPVNAPACPGHGWRPVTRTEPPVDHETDIYLCTAWIEWDGDRRTGNAVGWITYVGRRTNRSDHIEHDFDEPDQLSSQPSAAWLGEDRELADGPSFWQPAPPPPELGP